MTRMESSAVLTTFALFATSSGALGQARFEIDYQFNDQPEVVRTESYPYTVSASWDDPFGGLQRVAGLFPLRFAESGLFIHDLSQPARSDIEFDRLSAIRMQFGFDDLIFSSDQAEPILVDLNLDFGAGYIFLCSTADCVGVEYLTEVAVIVDGDTRLGSSMLTVGGAGEQIRERSGILSDLGETKAILIEGLAVPVNQPVSMSIEYAVSIRFPAGVWGGRTSMGSGSRGLGFAADRPIFTVPDGVRVDSVNGRIRDNVYAPCFADLDGDRALTVFDMLAYQQLFMDGDFLADLDGDRSYTIFDFLAFQNAFDAGCP